MDCQGCLGACVHPLEDGMYRCAAGIDGDRVVAEVTRLMA